jgi:hypothetical protein
LTLYNAKNYIDYLRDIIISLPKDDANDFLQQLKKSKKSADRKDVLLFQILNQKKRYKASDICTQLYGSDEKMNAYHSIRKRLFAELVEFVFIKRYYNDSTSSTFIMGLITLSNYLLDNNQTEAGWHYFQKVEEIALKNEQFDLLDNIYNAQIAQAHQPGAQPLETIIEKWKLNKSKAEEDERANVANTLIQYTLKKYRTEGKYVDIQAEITAIIEEYDLNQAFVLRPKLTYTMLSMIRTKALIDKQYLDFQDLIRIKYIEINTTVGFKPKDHIYKLQLLYMLSHVCYRNRCFDEALVYLKELEENLQLYNKQYEKILLDKLVLLQAAVLSYQGNGVEAIRILEQHLNEFKISSLSNQLNMQLNLVVYYFQLKEYGKSLRMLRQLDSNHNESIQLMGKEWVARKHLIEIIVQYEKGNTDIAYNLIKTMRKQHEQLLQLPIHHRSKVFIDLIEQFIDKPYWVTTLEFDEYLNQILDRWPKEQEDLQAMTFYCWLKSKMLKKDYYAVLVETVNTNDEV